MSAITIAGVVTVPVAASARNNLKIRISLRRVSILRGEDQEKFICFLDRYIRWYNEKRIKLSLGAMSPVKYRQHLGITT